MTHVAITILAQMSCPVPLLKVVVGSIPGSVGFLVLLAQGGGPKTQFCMPNSDLGGLYRPKSTNFSTGTLYMGVRSTALASP
jgi:hypothetical protein